MSEIDLCQRIKALSVETRLEIIGAIESRSNAMMTVGEVAEIVGITEGVASHHLAKLHDARLVSRIRTGRNTVYHTDSGAFIKLGTDIMELTKNEPRTEIEEISNGEAK